MRRRFTTAAVLVLAAAGAARGAIEFSVLPLGAFANDIRTDLNDVGQVVSTGRDDLSNQMAIRTQPNMPFNPATDFLPGTRHGYGINDLGQAVGDYEVIGVQTNGFRTGPNQPFDPATDGLGHFGSQSFAYAINNLGQVTGKTTHAFRTRPNLPLNQPTDDLGTLGGGLSEGRDINDLGEVVGFSQIAGNQFRHAFRTAPNAAINAATDDLGTLGGNNSFARAINSLGQVVGLSEIGPTTDPRHAFLTRPNQPINPLTDDLGTLGGRDSTALDVNDAGWVVGSSRYDPTDLNQLHAFLYRDGPMIDLNMLIDPAAVEFGLTVGLAVNNRGQVLASDFLNRLYLLTPVPEPSAGTLAVASAACFLLARRCSTARARKTTRVLSQEVEPCITMSEIASGRVTINRRGNSA